MRPIKSISHISFGNVDFIILFFVFCSASPALEQIEQFEINLSRSIIIPQAPVAQWLRLRLAIPDRAGSNPGKTKNLQKNVSRNISGAPRSTFKRNIGNRRKHVY